MLRFLLETQICHTLNCPWAWAAYLDKQAGDPIEKSRKEPGRPNEHLWTLESWKLQLSVKVICFTGEISLPHVSEPGVIQ